MYNARSCVASLRVLAPPHISAFGRNEGLVAGIEQTETETETGAETETGTETETETETVATISATNPLAFAKRTHEGANTRRLANFFVTSDSRESLRAEHVGGGRKKDERERARA